MELSIITDFDVISPEVKYIGKMFQSRVSLHGVSDATLLRTAV
jgi:hypothetical protein